jgi:hypothetical protein
MRFTQQHYQFPRSLQLRSVIKESGALNLNQSIERQLVNGNASATLTNSSESANTLPYVIDGIPMDLPA